MLHDLLTANREELIRRCKSKATKRFSPGSVPAAAGHGVPLFLQQVIDTLRKEQPAQAGHAAKPATANPAIGRTAALHGAELLGLGYSVEQVVHDYGDVCQAATELAVEQSLTIAADEFRTLNRCLDDAIAGAVAAYGEGCRTSSHAQTQARDGRLGMFIDEQRRLIDIALHSYSAIKTGSVGATGATGLLLVHALTELRALTDRTLAQLDSAGATG